MWVVSEHQSIEQLEQGGIPGFELMEGGSMRNKWLKQLGIAALLFLCVFACAVGFTVTYQQSYAIDCGCLDCDMCRYGQIVNGHCHAYPQCPPGECCAKPGPKF
jgi:hypothetical protein